MDKKRSSYSRAELGFFAVALVVTAALGLVLGYVGGV